MKRISLLVIFLWSACAAFAQGEKLTSLHANPVLNAVHHQKKKSSAASTPFSNPYIYYAFSDSLQDDFSYRGPYPDSGRWLNNSVFVNYSFPISPVNIGVASFDGLDANGYPYNFTGSPSSSVPCDTLTSKRIIITKTAKDSMYLSFYYQPQGRGFAPRDGDSLLMEFKTSHDSLNWHEVWTIPGYIPSNNDSGFHLVMLPLYRPSDTLVYTVDTVKFGHAPTWFQFRFRNYANPTGNLSHWHVDRVYLHAFRSYQDTILKRVSFVYEPLSFLANYQNEPWRQYQGPADVIPVEHVFFRNNDVAIRNMTYQYQGFHYGAPFSVPYSNTDPNMNPFTVNGYSTYVGTAFSNVKANGFDFGPSLSDTTVFKIRHILIEDNHTQDTIWTIQRFFNYYAYDDGTAELGYGLEGVGTSKGAQLAVQFSTNVPDSLRAVQFFWNPVLRDASLDGFRLCVWAPGPGGNPGTMIYHSDSTFSPQYLPGYDHFRTYYLKKPLAVSGSFFVGWLQYTDANMSVGFDQNTNSMNHNFYKVDSLSPWNASLFPGSLMIRPLFGDTIRMTGIVEQFKALQMLTVYPNPASDVISFSVPPTEEDESYLVSLYDCAGRLVLETRRKRLEPLDISEFGNGFYLLRISSKNNSSCTKKILIAR
ncbi:MAG TPA: T9SS type A sorting domain-containing protein [Bacteroidia bacterium]|jgi:hypothetical protein|nr:T9SS type A sorting domain-containing protein [Bacteroidia bacterium]